MNITIKNALGSLCIASLLLMPSLSSAHQGVLWINLTDKKTFGDYEISEVILETTCAQRWSYYGKDDTVKSGPVESYSKTDISQISTLSMDLNCESLDLSSTYSYNYSLSPKFVEMQMRYKDNIISCGKQELANFGWWSHKAKVTAFSGKDKTCSWSAR